MLRSLRAQLSLSILLVVMITVLLLSLLANHSVNRQFEEYVADEEKTQSQNIVNYLSSRYDGPKGGWEYDFLYTVGMYSLYDGYILKIYDQGGHVLWDAENHDTTLCNRIMEEISARMARSRKRGGFDTHTFDLTQEGQKVGSVSIKYYGPFFYSEREVEFLQNLNSLLVAIGAFAFVFSIAVGWLLARRLARPIVKTAQIAKQISKGNYNIRFEGETKTKELKDLVLTVNHLAEALFEQEKLRKQLTADVAHELRTPLAAVGSHLEAMIDGLWEITPQRLISCHEEIIRLGKLVADLECLARVEGENQRLAKTPVDLWELARSASEVLAAEWKKKGLSLSVGGESAVVLADRDKMVQVITNLLSNAMKFTPEGGNIEVSVKDGKDKGILSVTDDGIGIPEEELGLIFERFYRTDKSRNRKTGGAGIGLAIVKSIVEAHGGTVGAENRGGKGSRFTVTLPK